MKNEHSRLLGWEAEKITVLSYFVAYIAGFLTYRKSCSEAPHLSANHLRFFSYAPGLEAEGGSLCELLLPFMVSRSNLTWCCLDFFNVLRMRLYGLYYVILRDIHIITLYSLSEIWSIHKPRAARKIFRNVNNVLQCPTVFLVNHGARSARKICGL